METTMSQKPSRRGAIAWWSLASSVGGAAGACPGRAAKWPAQAVRFVVPFPAGSAPDVLIRHVGAKLGEKWGQGVIVDNKPGGSGVIGMNAILAAQATATPSASCRARRSRWRRARSRA
jgi:tripartite-type tricarboxylate transporter receptor subunit TctC